MNLTVTRYSIPGGDPDRLRVERDGEIALDVSMGPGGPLHPESAAAAKQRPWFYTGSPFGQEILDLHAARYLGI